MKTTKREHISGIWHLKELEGLKQRAAEYLDENGVMIGFVNNLLGL